MMYWFGNGMGGWAALMMILGTVLLGGSLIAVVALLTSYVRRGLGPSGRDQRAEEILAERFARGEIDAEDYRARLDALAGARSLHKG
jgi:putative membrane protein